jgi:hypothetical protein
MVAGAVQPPLVLPPAPLPPPEVDPEDAAVTVVCDPVEEEVWVTVVTCPPPAAVVVVMCVPVVEVVVPAPGPVLVGTHTPLNSTPGQAFPPQAARAAIAGIATIAPKTHIFMT